MVRDNFRRYTLAELEQRRTLDSRRLGLVPPLDMLVEELKLEEPPYRYSIIRDTRRPPQVRTQVGYRKFDGSTWGIIPIRSLGFLIEPMARVAREADARGDRVSALILMHALLEVLMRSDPEAGYRHEETFGDVAKKFRRRLLARDLPDVDVESVYTAIRAVNDRRNDVLKVQLLRDGYERTNEGLTAADFQRWIQIYEDTLNAVIDLVSL